MSENIFEPLCESIVYCSKIAYKYTSKALGINKYDFKKFFKEVNICNKSKECPRLHNIYDDEYYKRYRFECPIGVDLKNFKEKGEKLANFLNTEENKIRMKQNKFYVDLIILTKDPKPKYNPEVHRVKGFKVPIGLDLEKLKIRYWDIQDSANAHSYVAGTTRCGKSTLIRLITTMLIQKSVADIQLSLIDIKKVDLIEFKNCKNTLHYTNNEEDANDILLQNAEEMKRRYLLFSKNKGIKNIWNYRDKIGKMPIRLIIIEEIAVFEKDNEFHQSLKHIAQQGAGAGIFLLLATQLVNKDVLPNLTKQNINTVFGGRCKDSIRSDIIIEDGELNKLRGKGHMKVFDADAYGTEIQVLWIDDETVEEIAIKNQKRDFRKKRALDAGTSKTLGDNELN